MDTTSCSRRCADHCGADAVDALDVTLFDRIGSQTTADDRRSLLAVQRAVARHFGAYTYLEIGSHLGGSIQPHLLDPRCRRIYSIDPRPLRQPDDRGFVCHYPDNATASMLENLRAIAPDRVERIRTFELASADVDTQSIDDPPHLCFIDGEHTTAAVLRDVDFCRRVAHPDGSIVFHDADVIWMALGRLLRQLDRAKAHASAIVLGGSVMAIAFGDSPLRHDATVRGLRHSKTGYFMRSAANDLYRRGRRLWHRAA
ncbi:MAG: class I SAM-dependent methyltransferase [Phycisphaerales bacterium]